MRVHRLINVLGSGAFVFAFIGAFLFASDIGHWLHHRMLA